MIVFQSKRLNYRVWTTDDLSAGIKLWGSHQVMKFIEPELNEAQVMKSIENGKKHYDEYGTQHFAMVTKDNNQIIGACDFGVEEEEPLVVEFVIHIMDEFWHKGYGFEAGQATLEFVESLKPSKIIAACHVQNVASKNLLLKLGFDYKGQVWFEDTQRFEDYFERLK